MYKLERSSEANAVKKNGAADGQLANPGPAQNCKLAAMQTAARSGFQNRSSPAISKQKQLEKLTTSNVWLARLVRTSTGRGGCNTAWQTNAKPYTAHKYLLPILFYVDSILCVSTFINALMRKYVRLCYSLFKL